MNPNTMRTVCAVAMLAIGAQSQAAEMRSLSGHVPPALLELKPTGRLATTRQLELSIGLPLRDKDGLAILLKEIYDPASTNFHRYLTPDEFTAKFGPTKEDYEAAIHFATTNGLTLIRAYSNRVLFDVSGNVADIEKAFHITLRSYRHPTEDREFIAPDVEPSVEAAIKIQDIAGLSTFEIPHPLGHPYPHPKGPKESAGTGPGGDYIGQDFRNAYVPGVTLNGAGQSVGLVELDGYYPNDITSYETLAGLPNVPVQKVVVSGLGQPSTNANGVGEVSLDIEMVISMAPGLSKLYVFEGNSANGILAAMVNSNSIKQFSSSWSLAPSNATAEGLFQQMGTQGQSFFDACGDGDSWVGSMSANWPADSPNITSVGGTTLTMDAMAKNYISETAWNTGNLGTNNVWFANGKSGYWGTSGGISTSYSIPSWQRLVDTTTSGGSSSKRNVPDVSMTASQVWVIYNQNVSNNFIGTSCAAPLWAGFMALVNQQAANDGRSPVGFINPAIYSLANTGSYGANFHDITTGNNYWPGSPSSFAAASGYDLCTGLGTPTPSLISALETFSGAVWVDFSVAGPGVGTYDNPYNTLALGISHVANNNSIAIKGPNSTTYETTINKPMIITASGGSVTIH